MNLNENSEIPQYVRSLFRKLWSLGLTRLRVSVKAVEKKLADLNLVLPADIVGFITDGVMQKVGRLLRAEQQFYFVHGSACYPKCFV